VDTVCTVNVDNILANNLIVKIEQNNQVDRLTSYTRHEKREEERVT
jgi:hypothetical protein